MKKIIYVSFLLLCSLASPAQEFRSSLVQYQMNALPLNPAYSSYKEATGFEAIYFGNFAGNGQLSRSVTVNMQGATESGGLGLTFRFYRDAFFGEINLRPAWSRRFSLQNGGEMAFGAVLGINYFDVNNSFLSAIESDFMTFDGGFGIYYHDGRFFAGLSVINFLEKSILLESSSPRDNPQRENPYNFHAGGVFPLTQDLDLKPVILFKYTNVYTLPDQAFQNDAQNISFDIQANVFIQKTYLVGISYGFTKPEFGTGYNRYAFSATYIFGNFRLSYSIENNQSNNAVSLPVSHILSAGYDLWNREEGGVFRYF
ncbi:MAG TPA: type IX secretion system membrane protein PorP/SprF [Bacteroidetes bacterium]|nr:type IX secretion system membrane protein PorP/SprF [Bacteroidota bacterium]